MIRFSKAVDKRSRKRMQEFLSLHFRYHTCNRWNPGHSYAHCVKLRNLGLPPELEDTAYAMLDVAVAWLGINAMLEDWSRERSRERDGKWGVGFNGRSGGYMVLYDSDSRGIDDDAPEFETWSMAELRDRVELVQSFDKLCDDVLESFVSLCRDFEVVTETVMVPKQVQALKERGES